MDVNPPFADMFMLYPEMPRLKELNSDWAAPLIVCANEEPDSCEMPCIEPDTAAVAFADGGVAMKGSPLTTPAEARKPLEEVSPLVDELARFILVVDSPVI